MAKAYLDKDSLTGPVHPTESMTSVTAHETPSHRRGVIGHQHQPSVLGLGYVGKKVEPRVVIDEAALGVALLRTDVVRAHERIANEKDRPVETDKVIVAYNKGLSYDPGQ